MCAWDPSRYAELCLGCSLALPSLPLPYHTSPSLALPYLPYLTSPSLLTLPYMTFTLRYLTVPYLTV